MSDNENIVRQALGNVLRDRLEAAEKNGVPVLVVSVSDLRALFVDHDKLTEDHFKLLSLLRQVYEGEVDPSDLG